MILLVEDHASIREALASTSEGKSFEVVGQAGSMAETRRMLEETQQAIDVTVIDLGLPDGYGGDLIKELRDAYPQAQALILRSTLDHAQIARAVENEAAGILDKTAHLDQVAGSVRRLMRGSRARSVAEKGDEEAFSLDIGFEPAGVHDNLEGIHTSLLSRPLHWRRGPFAEKLLR